jgi:enoyl-CoA hydratase/carnithine racemase
MAEELLVDTDAGVTTFTINRPDVHNALSWSVLTALCEAVEAARDDPGTRVVVLTGAGDRAFCAGADLSGMAAGASHADLHASRGQLPRLFQGLWGLGKPTIAKVRGWCLAGGFGVALACDVVVASDDARFGTPEVDRGLWPYMITVPMLRSMPPKVALELQMSGRRVSAEEAARLGFARVVPAAELDAAVTELAVGLATKSSAVLRLGRDAFYAVADLAAADALRLLHPMLTVHTGLDDAAEGLAAFAEKREPAWTDR